MKILNLYAGIDGNRKLWTNVDVTAIEINPVIAQIYEDFFPKDKVIIGEAHNYLLHHYAEFDFIWSSPPCPSHSDWKRLWIDTGKQIVVYPDMSLYQEILLLQHFFKGKYCVENVVSYYKPLIQPQEVANHYLWANFRIADYVTEKRGARETKEYLSKRKGIILGDDVTDKRHLLRNCTEPELGLHILNCAFRLKQEKLLEVR
jgi:DNA (cytosine-5)-methyltransferase 1